MFRQHRAVHLDSEVGPFTFYHLTVFSSQNFLTDQTPGQAADWFLRPEESFLGGSEKLNHLDISDLRSSLERVRRLYLGEQPAFYLVSRVGEKLHFRGGKLSCQAGKQF